MEEYRIDMKVRNNLILTKIEEEGYQSANAFCLATGISYGHLISFINMKESIFDTKGRLKPFINKLCCELNCIPEELFTASQMEAQLKDNKRTLKVNEAEAVFYLTQANNQKLLEDHFTDEKSIETIDEYLSMVLKPRERKVIAMRMGLGEYDNPCSLVETASSLSLSTERIRQIESKAIRKLRHPIHWKKLEEYITLRRGN